MTCQHVYLPGPSPDRLERCVYCRATRPLTLMGRGVQVLDDEARKARARLLVAEQEVEGA